MTIHFKLRKVCDILLSDFVTLQQTLKDALRTTWKDAFSHDWVTQKEVQTCSLQELYTELKVTKMKTTYGNDKVELTSIHDILKGHGDGDESKPGKIVLEGNLKCSFGTYSGDKEEVIERN